MWWVGKKSTGVREAFSSTKTPSERSHGKLYKIVEGPFVRKTAAVDFARAWNAGGQATQEVERRSRRARAGNSGPRFGLPKMDDVIYWIRSEGPGPNRRDVVAMYFKGRLTKNTDEGVRGDVKGRPQTLGAGEYTAVYGADTFMNAAGERIWPNG